MTHTSKDVALSRASFLRIRMKKVNLWTRGVSLLKGVVWWICADTVHHRSITVPLPFSLKEPSSHHFVRKTIPLLFLSRNRPITVPLLKQSYYRPITVPLPFPFKKPFPSKNHFPPKTVNLPTSSSTRFKARDEVKPQIGLARYFSLSKKKNSFRDEKILGPTA